MQGFARLLGTGQFQSRSDPRAADDKWGSGTRSASTACKSRHKYWKGPNHSQDAHLCIRGWRPLPSQHWEARKRVKGELRSIYQLHWLPASNIHFWARSDSGSLWSGYRLGSRLWAFRVARGLHRQRLMSCSPKPCQRRSSRTLWVCLPWFQWTYSIQGTEGSRVREAAADLQVSVVLSSMTTNLEFAWVKSSCLLKVVSSEYFRSHDESSWVQNWSWPAY